MITPHVVLGHVSLVSVDILDIVALAVSAGRFFLCVFLRMGTTAIVWHDTVGGYPKAATFRALIDG